MIIQIYLFYTESTLQIGIAIKTYNFLETDGVGWYPRIKLLHIHTDHMVNPYF